MKNDIIIALKLMLICFTSVLLLSVVNVLTQKKIEQNDIKTEVESNKRLMPAGIKFEKKAFISNKAIKDKEYLFEVYNSSGDFIGWTVSVLGSGYGGEMKVMAAFDKELKVINVKLLNNSETPGIGKAAERDDYMTKFINTNTEGVVFPYKKSMLPKEYADSITGATITYNGIASAIYKAINLLKEEVKR